MWLGGQSHDPAAFSTGKETRCPLYMKLGGHQAGLHGFGKSRPYDCPLGIGMKRPSTQLD